MSDNNKPDRRSVLKSLGAGAAAVAGISGSVSAERAEITADERARIRKNEKFSRVYDEIGRPVVEGVEKMVATLGEGGESVAAYTFDTTVGDLRFTEAGSRSVAHFIFGEGVSSDSVPSKYASATRVDGASLLSNPDKGVTYVRGATTEEQKAVREAADKPSADVLYSDALGGFGIVSDDADRSARTMVEVDVAGYSVVSPNNISNEATTVVTSNEECDEGACRMCGTSSLLSVSSCGWVCATVATPPPVSIAGLVACLGCVVAAGVSLGYFCSECWETCK